MKMQICAFHDRAPNLFGQPIFVVAIGQALRAFSDELHREEGNNAMNQHPHDYTAWHIGTYDTDTGVITPIPPVCIATGKNTYTGPDRRPTVYEVGVHREANETAGR